MDKEAYVIAQFRSPKIGDDGAVVGEWVYSKDIFAEGTHFYRDWMSLTQIAQKSMLVNLSDAIAMNAVPKYALIGVTIPASYSSQELQELTRAFVLTCKAWDVELIGGDTTSGERLVISITIIAHTKQPVYRKGMRAGHLIAYTGHLGDSLKGLRRLLRGGVLGPTARFMKPDLKADFFFKAAPYVSAAMDLSDGLGKDLSRLCKVNNLGVRFTCKPSKAQLCSGEEYEMLLSFPPRALPVLRRIAQKTKTPLTIIGQAARGRFRSPCQEHHFKD
jgi:thiamine-monophosphate kinase